MRLHLHHRAYFRITWIALLLAMLKACGNKDAETGTLDNYVIMVSFDGFRWDYPDLYSTPNLDSMANRGVRAMKMIPSFPTKTFPNHFTIATGLFPDHHGIINNTFFAPDLGGIYRIGDQDMVTDPDAYFGEPIWVTAEKQGVKTASYFWVGSEAPIQDTYPSYWEPYNGSVPYLNRVDQVIKWMKLPLSERPGLILLYFDEPDHTGHEAGPEHPSTGKVVETLDSMLGYLRNEIAELPYGDRVNLIVLSDHGMGPISTEKYVNLYEIIKEAWTETVVGGNPFFLIDPAEGYADSIILNLNPVEGISAWKERDIPTHLHYGTSVRFPGIVVVADSLWSIGTRTDPSGYSGGAHGYDNAFTDMHTIFFAEGPDFKKGYSAPPFPNVDVYSIVAHILDLDPAATDGDWDRVSGMLMHHSSPSPTFSE